MDIQVYFIFRKETNMNHDIETQSYREQKEREIENQNKNRKQEISIGKIILWWIVIFIILAIMFEC